MKGVNFACATAFKLLQTLFNNKYDHEKMSKEYWNIESCGRTNQELKTFDADIEKDLLRTFPQVPQFAFNTDDFTEIQSPMYYRLRRVLSTFTYFDHTIGYMQGMNFIVATLMYHCNEEEAFWLFTQLIQHRADVRSVYQPPQMIGLTKHVQVLERIIDLKLPRIHKHMERLGLVSHQIYLADWVICLFTKQVPIDLSVQFLVPFFDEGWTYFYKFALSVLLNLEHRILSMQGLDQIIHLLKFKEDLAKRETIVFENNDALVQSKVFKPDRMDQDMPSAPDQKFGSEVFT